jgi:hypothetical protein
MTRLVMDFGNVKKIFRIPATEQQTERWSVTALTRAIGHEWTERLWIENEPPRKTKNGCELHASQPFFGRIPCAEVQGERKNLELQASSADSATTVRLFRVFDLPSRIASC